MKTLRIGAVVLARFLVAILFLASGMSKILHWQSQEGELLTVLAEWQSYVTFSEELQDFFATLIQWVPLLLVLGILCEFVGGLLVLLGTRERFGATLLILFLIPQTIIMHQFWFVDGPMREMQMAHFLKNFAILGGLFFILLHGAQGSEKNSFPSLKLG